MSFFAAPPKSASPTCSATRRHSCSRRTSSTRQLPSRSSQLSRRSSLIQVSNFAFKFLALLISSINLVVLGYYSGETNSLSPVRGGYSPNPAPNAPNAIQYQTSPPNTSYYSSPSPTTPTSSHSGPPGGNSRAEQVIASVAAPPTQAYTYSGTTTSKFK